MDHKMKMQYKMQKSFSFSLIIMINMKRENKQVSAKEQLIFLVDFKLKEKENWDFVNQQNEYAQPSLHSQSKKLNQIFG